MPDVAEPTLINEPIVFPVTEPIFTPPPQTIIPLMTLLPGVAAPLAVVQFICLS